MLLSLIPVPSPRPDFPPPKLPKMSCPFFTVDHCPLHCPAPDSQSPLTTDHRSSSGLISLILMGMWKTRPDWICFNHQNEHRSGSRSTHKHTHTHKYIDTQVRSCGQSTSELTDSPRMPIRGDQCLLHFPKCDSELQCCLLVLCYSV